MAFEQFNTHGHPGRFASSYTVTSGDFFATGSAYGVSAIIRGTGATGTIALSAGGSVSLSDLDAGVVHELSVQSVTDVANGSVYLLKRGH